MLDTLITAVHHAALSEWLLLLAGLLLFLYVLGTWNYDYFHRRGIASTKPKLPFVGNFLGLFTGTKAFNDVIKDIYEKGKGHDVYGVFELVNPLFVVRDPELIKVVGVKECDYFLNHRTFGSQNSDPILSKNLFNLKDQSWRDMRGTLSPAFTTNKLKGMLPLISECAEQLSQHLRKKYASSEERTTNSPLPVDMKNIFTRITNDVIATTAFGVSCDSLNDPNNEFYTKGRVMTTFSKLRTIMIFASLVFPKLFDMFGVRLLDVNSTNFFDSLVRETIRERQKKGIFRPDILQLLMQAREGKLKVDAKDAAETEEVGSKGTKLTEEDMSSQAIIFFFGGFETVSSALCITTHVLSHNPDVQKRLQDEIAQVMGETGGKPTYESVQGLKYLDAVIHEALRMYPPAPVLDRVCQKDTTVSSTQSSTSFTISKGNVIFIPVIGLHHDPKYWEEPEKFDPERFSDENKHKIKPYTYMPFGVGPRICIGQRFALIEVKMALVHLLHNFHLHPCAKTKHPLEYQPGTNFMARGGFWCGLTVREE